jgi:hypothetical protein
MTSFGVGTFYNPGGREKRWAQMIKTGFPASLEELGLRVHFRLTEKQ